ncbi:MAG: hypothetical protein EOP05_22175, partial [Proteobacteria bacterium]
RISTRKLNDFFFNTIRQAPAPVWGVQNVKFYYLTQTNQQPPAFIAFANHADGVSASYRRFISKNLQKEFGLEGIPIRIFVMSGKHGQKRKRVDEEVEAVASMDASVEAEAGTDFEFEIDGMPLKEIDLDELEKLDEGESEYADFSDFDGDDLDGENA